uniref:Uncharacterized protein n=1 Tax=Kwoniella dejecticola CBS 10117 TaxID=1296121 RepID=A0A1A6AFM3_9TREE|nr:uncharacterized protein I303_00645 [Kwoniella dejecticola CBS 10117]OBR88828.1 hypothetical protein I303_00645 [Kwoniella dejecticola CBS 10117]
MNAAEAYELNALPVTSFAFNEQLEGAVAEHRNKLKEVIVRRHIRFGLYVTHTASHACKVVLPRKSRRIPSHNL